MEKLGDYVEKSHVHELHSPIYSRHVLKGPHTLNDKMIIKLNEEIIDIRNIIYEN